MVIFSGSSLLSQPAYPVLSLGHMCTHDHDLCTFSSHGAHKSAHHTCSQFHIHVSSIPTRLCCGKPSEVVPSIPFGNGTDRLLTTALFLVGDMTLFSGIGTDVHFSGDESGMQWEDYLFELQNAVEWRLVAKSRRATADARHECAAQYVRRYVRLLIDEGAHWIVQGSEQEQRERTAGLKALCGMLASTTSGRAKELVKQGLSDRNGTVTFGRIRERFGKTAGVAKLTDVFQFQRTSSHSLADKWLRWLKLMRQVNLTSLGDDARETLTSAGLEKAKERSLEQHLRLRAPQTWVVLCASVDQYLRSTVDSRTAQPTPMESVLPCKMCACCGKSSHEKSKCRLRNAKCSSCGKTGHLEKMCRQREKSVVK